MTRTATSRSHYRVTRRLAAIHRKHAEAAYPGCVLCIISAVPTR